MEGSGCDQHGGHHRVLLRVLVEQDNGLGPTHPDLTGAELPPPSLSSGSTCPRLLAWSDTPSWKLETSSARGCFQSYCVAYTSSHAVSPPPPSSSTQTCPLPPRGEMLTRLPSCMTMAGCQLLSCHTMPRQTQPQSSPSM